MKRMLIAVLALILALAPVPMLYQARAASPVMPALGSAVLPLQFHLTGTIAAATYAGIISFRAPFDMRVLYVTVVNRAEGGTQGVSTLGCLNAGTLFTNAVDLTGTPGAILEAALVAAQQNIAKDATVTCDLTISGGTAPTISDITVMIWVQRRS